MGGLKSDSKGIGDSQDMQTLIQTLEQNSATTSHYFWDGMNLWYKGRLMLIPNSCLNQKLFQEFRASPHVGHSGYLRIYKQLTRTFY